ncbi:glutamine--fructose-6-phosphate transaminase (isomerizing) [Oscillibacter sp. 1-3]|uniref:glutamine--fructose-6-phosphate transaminase (isomerizing) n=1 Tax=Oscillibacter sp. 1-3 TaxID=1235797 RepID=UPI00033D1E41|nr:glutamine--fructose-6-phosphate transaminase (isomerizing) [Oscillibacter sp. 1-3]EOS63553.1 glutamine-fructose-6-phosphate transaminase (isomerizing) [Oscillibacter sp. 1-3]
MCGIIGFAGRQDQAAPILLDGLERMEYRGYDSAGIAVRSETRGLQVRKTKGRLRALSDLTRGGADLEGVLGIGHTRWATHGEPNDVNAHPHVSENGSIALVHNGIIENYLELKEHLMKLGVNFASDTDSEVVAQLLEYHYNECHNMLEAVGRVLRRIEGSYAFGIVCSDYPNALIAARKDSPLILGKGENGNFIASDVTAIIKYARDVIYMEDGEIAVVTPNSIDVFDDELIPVDKKHNIVDWDVSAAEKGGYAHFMFKEILEQPEAIRKTISPRIRDGRIVLDDITLTTEYARKISRIYMVACGSAYHAGIVGKYVWEQLLRRPVEVVLASEFRYSEPLVDGNTLVITISQSGETLDTMAALREAKRLGGRTLAICNVVGSSIAREADDVLYTWAGPEIAVATSKGYSTQLAALDLVGLYLADLLGTVEQSEYDAVLAELQILPEKMERYLKDFQDTQYFASRYFNHNSVFYIGRNLDYAMGLEGSLKLKEISYIHSEAYASGELKHGTISLIEPGTLVVALGTYGPLFDKAMSNVVEVKARGAEVLAVTTEGFREKMAKTADAVVAVPDTHPILQPSLGIVPLQLFAYYVALQRGCDIDKPRNLAKSVTVE